MNVAYINPFLKATRDVFDKMVHVPLVQGRPYMKDPAVPLDRLFELSAVITLSGAACGLAVLMLSESVALALASGLAGSPVLTLDAGCVDAISEIVNMVAGGAKRDMPGGQVTLSVPTMVRTEKLVYPHPAPSIMIPYDTPHGRFTLEVAFRATTAAAARAAS
jgi:CheY-specific phosphatase CheX